MSCGLYAAAADHVEHDGSMAPGRAWRAPAPPGRQDPAGVSTGMPRGPPSASAPGLAGAQGQAHGRITLALVFSSVLPGPALPGQLADDPPAPSRSVTAIGKSDALPAAAMGAGVGLPGRRQARAEQMIGVRSSHLGDTPGQFPVMR